MTAPLFSIIVIDHESIDRDAATRGILSLAEQTFKDFEIILVHDGPPDDSDDWRSWAANLPPTTVVVSAYATGHHHGAYGVHSITLGMLAARGDWFVIFNVENELVPGALNRLAFEAKKNSEVEAMIFGIYHEKLGYYLPGVPAVEGRIDRLQLVGRADMWKEMGWWSDVRDNSDGYLYEEITQTYEWIQIPDCLGLNR